MTGNVSKFSVFTLLHVDTLNRLHQDGGVGALTEGKPWVTGARLFHEAQKAGQRMPVIFADAAYNVEVIFYAFLTDVRVHGDHNEGPTDYRFEGLTPVSPPRRKSELMKRDGNVPLSDRLIWPYALVYTPDFIYAA